MKYFLESRSGNVATMFAFLTLPLMLAAGAAVDYTEYSRKKVDLQNSLDAAALFVAPDIGELTQPEITDKVEKYLDSHLSAAQREEIGKLQVMHKPAMGMIIVQAEAMHPTAFLKLAGIETLSYRPFSEVTIPGNGFEIVLVLDSTHSMSVDGKMDALKAAATSFVTKLTALNRSEDRVKIGIVPFSNYVNVGLSKRNETWLDAPEDRTENICWTSTPIISKSGCSTVTRYNDGVPYEAEQCTNITYGEPTETCGDVSYTWRGCVGSRQYPLNLQDRSYATRVPGVENSSCAREILPITADEDILTSAINDLYPSGSTYLPAGISWGLRTLSDSKPFDQGTSMLTAQQNNIQKIMILMSDGENQNSAQLPDSHLHWGNDLEEANSWTLEACREVKRSDIKLYTIGFGDGINADTRNMLENCSTEAMNYYPATDNERLLEVFDRLAGQIANLHISK